MSKSGLKEPRVVFSCYPTAFQVPGGGEVQLLKTFQAVRKLGIHAELFDPWKTKMEEFDILHHFSFDPGGEPAVRWAHEHGLKVALSTIIWVESEGRFPVAPVKAMADQADILLPNSRLEADRLAYVLGYPKSRFKVVSNGVDEAYERKPAEGPFLRRYGLKDFVLCTARFDHRKNQIGLIRALKDTDLTVVFIGGPVDPDYYALCRREATPRMHFLGQMASDAPLLRSAYAACKVFVMPGLLETPGIAALEAGAWGANLVVTQEGSTREYFGRHARYVHPLAFREMKEAVLKAFAAPRNGALRAHILRNFTWNHAGRQTVAAYRRILARGAAPPPVAALAPAWQKEGLSPRSDIDLAGAEFQTRLGWGQARPTPLGIASPMRNGRAEFFLLNNGAKALRASGYAAATGELRLRNGSKVFGKTRLEAGAFEAVFPLPSMPDEILEFAFEWPTKDKASQPYFQKLSLS